MTCILIGGAINTDLIGFCHRAPEAGETITGFGFEIHGGGKAANQAVAVARSGGSAMLIGAVGQDDFGDARLRDLAADGVRTDSVVVRDDIPSGVALITVEDHGENRICYIPAATLSVNPDDAIRAAAVADVAAVLLPNELRPETLEGLMRWAREREIPVIYNIAPYSDDARQLAPLADVLIANETELADLTGAEFQLLDEQLAQARALGPETIILTRGDRGVTLLDAAGRRDIPGHPVQAVDTTGAGDTFCGVLASRLANEDGMDAAVRIANAAGAVSVMRRGAQSSIPTWREIQDFLAAR